VPACRAITGDALSMAAISHATAFVILIGNPRC
jgi:hypothetical protein